MSPALEAASGYLLTAEPAQVLPAREQMAFTLGFHIILVPFGVAFTFLMLIANWRGLRRGDEDALRLARRWSHVAGVLFAVGAVSGTVLSFEMGLLWPRLMGRFGAAYGIPFTVAAIATPVQIYVGDVAAREVYKSEPAKFAAIELLPKTGTHVPEVLGGVLINGRARYGIPIPNGASLLSGFSSGTRIRGLN